MKTKTDGFRLLGIATGFSHLVVIGLAIAATWDIVSNL